MPQITNTGDALDAIRKVRQVRQFDPTPVDPRIIAEILEVARWSGSSQNNQPWRFVIVDDRDQLQQLSEVREALRWVSAAPMVVAIVLDGNRRLSEAYDEGRVTERIMIAAKLLGLGAAIAWFGDAAQQARAKEILDVPDEATARSLVAIGHPVSLKDQGSSAVSGGRKPLDEIVSYGRLGEKR